MLLEASDKHGGGVSIDAIGKMKGALPTARVFSWADKGDGFFGGKVHAKVAVADENFCFISRANQGCCGPKRGPCAPRHRSTILLLKVGDGC